VPLVIGGCSPVRFAASSSISSTNGLPRVNSIAFRAFAAAYLKIENPSYMARVIEAKPEPGPLGLAAISVDH
jgi:hypothetical protein